MIGGQEKIMKNKFFSSVFWKFNEQISSQIITFIISIILARLLTPNDYGTVALINIFIVIADVFVTSGLGSSLIQSNTVNDDDFSTIFYINEIISIILYMFIYVSAPYIATFYHNGELIIIIRILALKLPLSAFNAIQQAYVSKYLMFRKVFISTTIAAIISGIIGVICAYSNLGVWALVLQYLTNTIIISILLYSQLDWHPSLIFKWKKAKPLIKFGWKILLTSLLGQVFNQLRPLLLGKFYTPTDLAFYNRGQKFPDLVSLNIDGTISAVLFPVMSKHNSNLLGVKKMTRTSIKMTTFIIMPLMFGMAATSKAIILLLLTEKWIFSVPYMQFLCIAAAFGTVSNANMQALSAIGRSDVLLRLELIKKPIYILFLIIGVKISVLAVAYTMMIYSILVMFINAFPNIKLLNYNIKEQFTDIMPALSASIIMYIIVNIVGQINLHIYIVFVLQIFLGIIVYLLIAKIFKLEAWDYLVKMIMK